MNSKLKTKNCFSAGSALILTVVLTTLLAIVGVAFVLVARVDKTATSAIAENKQLNLAVDSVVATICQQLAEDVPGMQPAQEYYDYPGYTRAPGVDGTLFTPDDVVSGDAWLASLEPRIDDNGTPGNLTDDVYYWPQISDIYEAVPGWRVGLLEWYGVQDTWRESAPYGDKLLPHLLRARIIAEANSVSGAFDTSATYAPIYFGGPADADGDGVADSRWVAVPNMTSKGRDVYTAVRIVDNGGMLNVNTGYKLLDPGGNPGPNGEYVDGSSQMQINLMALSQRGATLSPEQRLLAFRGGSAIDPNDIRAYDYNVVRRYDRPAGPYTPFDISDELKLRNRYILCYNKITTRIEELWDCAYDSFLYQKEMPLSTTDPNIIDWFYLSNNSAIDPNFYNYAHISTTYNMDRIIDPNGLKMFGVNTDPNVQLLYGKLLSSIDAGLPQVEKDRLVTEYAQAAANIVDYGDNDSQITGVYDSLGGVHYGFERPCIYISELSYHYVLEEEEEPGAPRPPAHASYAIEVRQHYWGDNSDEWRVVIAGPYSDVIDVTDLSLTQNRYRVIIFEDPCASLAETVDYSDSPAKGEKGVDPNVTLRWDPLPGSNADYSYDVYFGMDLNSVENADNASPEFVDNFVYDNRFYYPGPLDTNTPYFWRIDDVYDSNVIGSSGAWSFTTWAGEPNSIYDIIGPNEPPIFDVNTVIALERRIVLPDGSDTYIKIDEVAVSPVLLPPVAPVAPVEITASIKRDVSGGLWIKRIWDFVTPRPPSLGNSDGHYFAAGLPMPESSPIQAWPANHFRNIGETGLVLRKSAYLNNPLTAIGPGDTEFTARVNLADPNTQKFLQFLTRFDPSTDFVDNDGDGAIDEPNDSELKIAGRININTAPWYVIAQLPWVSPVLPGPPPTPNYDLARAIVAYRDKLDLSGLPGGPDYFNGRGFAINPAMPPLLREELGFASTGELNNVIAGNIEYSMRYYLSTGDELTFPDLTAGGGRSLGDGYANDFEERDLIFARISDLVTVRSDVFTAYILVRIGTDGPQERVIAILDRSDVYPAGGRVKIRALYQVPDPR